MRRILIAAFVLCCSIISAAQTQLAPAVKAFVKVDSPVTVLEHVLLVDGTGAKPDQTIVISGGKSFY